MKIKGAIFDMDGTLVDSLMFWDFYWERFNDTYIKQDDFKPDPELDKFVRTTIFTEVVKKIRQHYKLDMSYEEFFEFSQGGIAYFYRTVAKCKKGAIELLEYLRQKDIKKCMATATARKEMSVALESCGLEKYFDHILSCCDIGVGKDHPDIYLLAKEKLGT